jgi:hypothetical protein
MKRLLAALVLLALACGAAAQEQTPDRVARLRTMVAQAPDDPGLQWELSVALARKNDPEAAVWVGRLLDLDLDVDLDEKAFDGLRSTPPFAALARRAKKTRVASRRSEVLFTVPDRDLVPEGLAYDPVEDAYYLGSVAKRKVVRVGRDRAVRDFTTEGQDGLFPVLGLRVLPERRLLYVMSAAENGPDAGKSGLFVYDLKTGALVKKVLMEDQPPKHLFNDVAVSASGEAFLTDSEAGAVWRARPLKTELEPLVRAGTLAYPNGIALSPDGKTLYVADALHGLSRVDMTDGTVRPLAHARNVVIAGIDGLYADKEGLVGVQNGLPVTRASRLALSPAGDAVVSVRVLETRHPLFAIPTTGALANGFFALLATSHLEALDENGKPKPDPDRGEVRVLKVPLR